MRTTPFRRAFSGVLVLLALVLFGVLPATSAGAATQAKVSQKAAVKAWLAANGLEVVSLEHQEPTISAHPNAKSTALYDGCYAFAGALTNAVKLGRIANTAAEKDWLQVLAHFEAATEDCFMGISAKSASKVLKARSQLSDGNHTIATLIHLGK
ncbi:MAG TPA: hypothetical protein VGF87_06665 [Acidimicrobiales bacterium]